MTNAAAFPEEIKNAYSFPGASFMLGAGMLEGKVHPEAVVRIPLRTMNRHGLITGATGTGKTKTLQLLAEGLSDAGVPVLLMDIKGDLSGLAAAGVPTEKTEERSRTLGIPFQPTAYPVELLALGPGPGTRLRATVSEFGPVLLSRILGLNDTQESFVAMIFKFCDDQHLPLLDLKDFTRVLQYVSGPGKKELSATYGNISPASLGTILRKVIELQQQGADGFFGERSFDVKDLLRKENGKGVVSILRLTDMQDKPKLFSTFMLQLLAELFAASPEKGDPGKPEFVMFIDEAHLVFREASDALLQQIETVIRLIRSKGIGIYFCTQNPMDIPAPVLGQLGLKVQHALRAFTAADRKIIKKTAENFPESGYYKTDELITNLGIGEALVTVLNDKGIPAPLVHTMICPPKSRMDILAETEISSVIAKSAIREKYNELIDSESAYEMLAGKMEESGKPEVRKTTTTKSRGPLIKDPVLRSMARTAGNTIVRSILGVLGIGGRRSKY